MPGPANPVTFIPRKPVTWAVLGIGVFCQQTIALAEPTVLRIMAGGEAAKARGDAVAFLLRKAGAKKDRISIVQAKGGGRLVEISVSP